MTWVKCKDESEVETFFKEALPVMRRAAKDCGYALGVHGSMRRDLDLIAVPWDVNYLNKDMLAAAIQKAACGLFNESFTWEKKPHGRLATSFAVCMTEENKLSNGHVDLSVVGLPLSVNGTLP